ncbi:MAG: hypothetical protein AAGD07_24005 [Planctomycetota bacterium]
MSDRVRLLDLEQLGTEPGLPALTVSAGRYLAEAAAVCLHANAHTVGVTLTVSGAETTSFELRWQQVSQQMINTYFDLQDATEDGACGVAILLIRELAGLSVVQRSRKCTGIDYWLGDDTGVGASVPLVFEHQARLEVSGILRGSASDVNRRVSRKRRQVERSTGTPVYVVVIEFGTPFARVEKSDASADQSTS